MNLGSAALGLLIALGVKVVVMVLAARLVLRLYASTHHEPPRKLWLLLPEEERPRLRLLWWSLVLFTFSELTCGVELYILLRSSPVLSGTHAVVSGVAMGMFVAGLVELFDLRLLRYGGPSCLLNRYCRGCTIEGPEGCKFRPLLLIAATFVAMAALPPLFVSTDRMDAVPERFLLPFPAVESWYSGVVVPWLTSVFPAYDPSGAAYYLPESMFQIEFRWIPVVAGLLALGAIGAVLRRHEEAGLRIAALAGGTLCYSYFEIVCYRVIDDALLGSLAHEVAELWFIVATAELLVRVFPPSRATEGAGAWVSLPDPAAGNLREETR